MEMEAVSLPTAILWNIFSEFGIAGLKMLSIEYNGLRLVIFQIRHLRSDGCSDIRRVTYNEFAVIYYHSITVDILIEAYSRRKMTWIIYQSDVKVEQVSYKPGKQY